MNTAPEVSRVGQRLKSNGFPSSSQFSLQLLDMGAEVTDPVLIELLQLFLLLVGDLSLITELLQLSPQLSVLLLVDQLLGVFILEKPITVLQSRIILLQA